MSTTLAGHSNSPWSLAGTRATLIHCGVNATVDVATPSRGLTQINWNGASLAGHLLGVDAGIAASPDDAYVRGADLVVVYRETAERPYTVQVYWSAGGVTADRGPILDATISIQTRQWEAYPRVRVTSELGGAGKIEIEESVLIRRPSAAAWTYVEVAPALDFQLDAADSLAWQFRDHFMERGVIRRLRVRGALVPREDDQAAARHLLDGLLTEPPPLTA